MSWRWSRLAILAFLAVLYAAPLSSGDKGLWLSVASMPIPLFGAIPGGTPPEYAILLPDRAEVARAQACYERGEPSLGACLAADTTTTTVFFTTAASEPAAGTALDLIRSARSVSRGPPA